MSEENRIVEEKRQQVIGMVTEARARIERQAEKARGIRDPEDVSALERRAPEELTPERRRQALDEVVGEARTRTAQLIRDAREDVSSGVVGAGGSGTPIRSWQEGLSAAGRAAVAGMVEYLDAAERVFGVDLEELETGEAPPAAVTAERDAAAAEVAAYEEAHPAPAGVVPARDRWETIR